MPYSDFSLEGVIETFDLVEERKKLFENVQPLAASSWLKETFDFTFDFALTSSSEKARSEFIVAPILIEMDRQNHRAFVIYSERTLDVDQSKGLTGECDFLLSKGKLSKTIQAPIFVVVAAKKQDIDLGLGQCVAQMFAAQLSNQHKNNAIEIIFGCVTTGESWQFLRLKDQALVIDSDIYYINRLEQILGVLQSILNFYQ